MSVKARIYLEKVIAARVVDELLKAGFSVTVNDGEEDTLKRSKDKAAILKAMMTTDEDYLFAVKGTNKAGWVRFTYGNDGDDVVSDYTTNLEEVLAPVDAWIDSL